MDQVHVTSQSDPMDPARATALQVALGKVAPLQIGDPLPPFFHQVYFWTPDPPQMLGRDGHPQVGRGVVPDMGLPRRMWAGGRLTFQRPLRAGVLAEKRSQCDAVTRKVGRSGPLAFVTLRHDILQEGHLCVQEWQDLVYRADPSPDAVPPVPPQARKDEEAFRTMRFDSTLLFRYSALTLNGHRIHYDLEYARDVEGYRGLVVHGPLLAHLLMQMAQEVLGTLKHFSFRATAPLMHFETAELCRSGRDFWVRGPEGRLCMTAKAESRRDGHACVE